MDSKPEALSKPDREKEWGAKVKLKILLFSFTQSHITGKEREGKSLVGSQKGWFPQISRTENGR